MLRALDRSVWSAILTVIALVLFTEGRAFALCDHAPTPNENAIVKVESRLDVALGAVVGNTHWVVVPSTLVAIDHPGHPDARVYDAKGVAHVAWVISVDEVRGLALLQSEDALAEATLPLAKPRHKSSREHENDDAEEHCLYSVTRLDAKPWQWIPIEEEHGRAAPFKTSKRRMSWAFGAPIIDDEGNLVGMIGATGAGVLLEETAVDERAITHLLDHASEPLEPRYPLTLDFGVGLITEFEAHGGLWIGGNISGAVVYRDLVTFRLDGTMSLLAPPPNEGSCVEGCASGLRVTLTPSVGPRISILNAGRFWNVAVTPSIGLALGAQYVSADGEALDIAYPSTWALAAPGVAVSVGPIEARGRLRIHRGDATADQYEIGIGAFF